MFQGYGHEGVCMFEVVLVLVLVVMIMMVEEGVIVKTGDQVVQEGSQLALKRYKKGVLEHLQRHIGELD